MAVYGFTIKDSSGNILLDQDGVALNYIGKLGGIFQLEKYNVQGHVCIPNLRMTLSDPNAYTTFLPGYLHPTYKNYAITPGITCVSGQTCNALLSQVEGSSITDGDTITIGNKTYRFKNTPAQANDITIDNTAGKYYTMRNLKYAINGYHAIEDNGDLWCHHDTVAHTQVVWFPFPDYIYGLALRTFRVYAVGWDVDNGDILISSGGTKRISHPASLGNKCDPDEDYEYIKTNYTSPPGYCPLPSTWKIWVAYKYFTNDYLYNDSL